MAVNHNSVNTIQVDGAPEYSVVVPETDILSIEQSVYTIVPETDLLLLEQEVLENFTFEGNILTIEQSVAAITNDLDIMLVEQTVLQPGQVVIGCDLVDWDVIVTINGNLIPNENILEEVIVERGENEASLASFTLNGHKYLGYQNVCEIQGKPVTISVNKDGQITRIYTGIVDYPEYDIIQEKTKINCTDRRREQINSQLGTVVKSIGYWTEEIFGEAEDVADELDDRLTTVPKTVDFDAFGNYQVSDLLPKSTPDIVLSSTDILKRTPNVEVLSRARIINKVVIDFGYRFNRLHQSNIQYLWQHPDINSFCQWAKYGRTLASREMIYSAAVGAGWAISPINYNDLWPGGWYNCEGQKVGWQPITTLGTSWKDSGQTYTDSNGQTQQIQERESTTVQDMNAVMCLGASWGASKRWAQNLTEKYLVTVQAPESIAQFGEVKQDRSYGISSDYDIAEWEQIQAYTTSAGQYESSKVTLPGTTSFYVNLADNRSIFNESYLVAVNQARTTIIKTHRDNRSFLQITPLPELDLRHTVQVQMSKLEQLGKVIRIRHVFKATNHEAYTEVELASSKVCAGSATDTPLSIPSAPAFPSAYQLDNVGLGNHFGLDPDTYPGAESWTGMVGNQIIGGYSGTQEWTLMTQYPISFTVESPDIPDNLRNEIEAVRNVSYDVKIPNNDFNVIYLGDCG